MEYKKCLQCGESFSKPKHCSKKYWLKRKFCSFKCNALFYKIGDTNRGKFGKDSVNWKGDKIQKDSLHCWIGRTWGNPKKCEICGTINSPKFEWSNKFHTYKRDRNDWQRLCKKCHTKYDIEHNGYIIHNPRTTYASTDSRKPV